MSQATSVSAGPRLGFALPGSPALRRAVAGLALLALLAAGGVIAVDAAAGPSFAVPSGRSTLPGWMSGAFTGLGTRMTGALFLLLVGTMVVAYAVALVLREEVPLAWLIGAIVGAHLIFLLAPPLMSTDVFSYVDYGRLGAVHGLNPYVHGPADAARDPALPYVGHIWRHTRSVYGPVFSLTGYAVAPLGVPGALWAFKTLAALSSLACAALAWVAAGRMGRSPRLAAALVGLNPVLLVYGVGGGHNDLIMIAGLAAAITLAAGGREAPAGVAVVAAAAIKLSAIFALPYLLVGVARRRRALAGAAISSAVVIVVGLAVFGPHLVDLLSVLGRVQRRVSGDSTPNQVAGLFGIKGGNAFVRVLAHVLLAGGLGWLLWRTWRGASWVVTAGWAMLVLVLTTTWLLAWYVLWPLPFAAASQDRRLLAATLFVEGIFLIHGLTPIFT